MKIDYTYKNISEEILAQIAVNPFAKNPIAQYKKANSDKLKAIWGYKIMELATPAIWQMWYQEKARS